MNQKTTTVDYGNLRGPPKFALAKFSWEEFEAFWPGIEAMLDTVPHTWKHWTKHYIYAAVESEHLQVWGIGPPPDAVLIFFTQVATYPRDKVLVVPWGAGQFEPDMLAIIETALTHYAKMNDCVSIEVRGRPGWDLHFKSIGMKREFVTWSLPVISSRTH